MWTAWCVCGWLMVATKRYCKRGWLIAQLLHSLTGTFITVVTINFIVKILKAKKWQLHGLHGISGIVLLAFCVIIYISGVTAALIGKFRLDENKWGFHKEIHNRIFRFHTLLARFNILLGYCVSTLGLIIYQQMFYADDPDFSLAIASPIAFFFLIITVEVVFRIWRRKHTRELDVPKNKKEMTVEEFKKRCYDKNHRLSIIDNMVVNIGDFEQFHPGGIFQLKKNYGRDITKFFNGAYKLCN